MAILDSKQLALMEAWYKDKPTEVERFMAGLIVMYDPPGPEEALASFQKYEPDKFNSLFTGLSGRYLATTNDLRMVQMGEYEARARSQSPGADTAQIIARLENDLKTARDQILTLGQQLRDAQAYIAQLESAVAAPLKAAADDQARRRLIQVEAALKEAGFSWSQSQQQAALGAMNYIAHHPNYTSTADLVRVPESGEIIEVWATALQLDNPRANRVGVPSQTALDLVLEARGRA